MYMYSSIDSSVYAAAEFFVVHQIWFQVRHGELFFRFRFDPAFFHQQYLDIKLGLVEDPLKNLIHEYIAVLT